MNPGMCPGSAIDIGVPMNPTLRRRRLLRLLRACAVTAVVVLAVAGCSQFDPSPPTFNPGGTSTVPAVDTAAPTPSALTAQQLAGQRVIYAFKGPAPSQSLLYLISHGEAAGVLFFSDNFVSSDQFKGVVAQLEQANNATTNPVRRPLLLMTDQEGGQVKRLPGGPDLSEKQIGQSGDLTEAADAGQVAAHTLLAFGLNTNLAPVLDVYRQSGNFIDQYGRSYSGFAQMAGQLGAAYVRGIQTANVVAAAKHFPGLGAAAAGQDTDAVPVTLGQSVDDIRQVDEAPYTSAIAAGVKMVMA